MPDTDRQLAEVRLQLQEVKEQLCEIHKETKDIIELFKALEGGFKVIKWLGKLATPIVAIAAAWTAIKSGFWR